MVKEIIVNPYSLVGAGVESRAVARKVVRKTLFIDSDCATAPAGEFHICDLDIDAAKYSDAVRNVAVLASHRAEIPPLKAKPLDLHIVALNDELLLRRARSGEKAGAEITCIPRQAVG